MTKGGKQATPEWLAKALGATKVKELPGEGMTIEQLLGDSE